MPPAAQLGGARAKLQRAEEHFGQLVADHSRFITERNPYRMLREADPEPGFYIWRAKIVEPPPLEKWAAMAGECVHALRSALDHTAFELVRINRPASEYSEFPIFKEKGGEHGWDAESERQTPRSRFPRTRTGAVVAAVPTRVGVRPALAYPSPRHHR